MDFSSHFRLPDIAEQALAEVASNSLVPALKTGVEHHLGSGSALDTEAFELAYEALMQLSQSGNLEASLETAFGSSDHLWSMVEAIVGPELGPGLSAELEDLDFSHGNGVYAQLPSLAQSWGDQTVVDSLTGLILEGVAQVKALVEQPISVAQVGQLFLGEESSTTGEFMGPLRLALAQEELTPPISVMRLSDGEDSAWPRQADLQVSNVVVTRASSLEAGDAIAPGENLTVAAQFHNLGNQTTGASTIRYWLSDDLVLDDADQALGSQRLEAMAPDSQAQRIISFEHQQTWGVGTKYVLVEADGADVTRNGGNNLSHAPVQVAQADLQQYWFYYSFNPANPESADSYLGSVIAPEGTYAIAPGLPGGGHDPAYGFNPTAQLTEANADGKYLVYGKSDYSDERVADQGKVFVLSYTDRGGDSVTRITPNQYAQGGQPSGLNFLGSESDYLGNVQASTRFGQDYYEADTGNPDIDIQAYTPFGYFSAMQRSAIGTAISNWEQLIVGDKDGTGILKLAFTHSAQRLDGSTWSWVWGEAYLDQVVGQRIDRDYDVVDIGGDFHNRVNYNSVKLGQLSTNQLIRLTMHEIGHALGLDEAQEDALLGLDSVMDKHGLDAKVTEGMFQRLESLGYKVDRAAADGLQWS